MKSGDRCGKGLATETVQVGWGRCILQMGGCWEWGVEAASSISCFRYLFLVDGGMGSALGLAAGPASESAGCWPWVSPRERGLCGAHG